MEVARWVAAAEAALGSADLAGARAALARLGELAPEHAQLGSLRGRLEEAAARVARRERLSAIAASVRELLTRDDVDAAGQAVEEALALDGEDAEARALGERVEARRAERAWARRAALERRVAHAQARLASGDLVSAIERFEAVLAEDQSHEAAARGLAEARSRRAALEAREAAAAVQAALDARAAEGRLRLSEGDLVGAIERFEAVLQDGTQAEAQRGLGEARERRAALEAQEKEATRRAVLDARVAAGRLRLSAGDVVGAIERFVAVLAEAPGHAEARRELAEARQRLMAIDGRAAAAARRTALDARVAEALARLASGDPYGAIERFEAVLRDDGTHVQAQRGLAEARDQRTAREAEEQEAARRAALDARVAEAQARLASGDPGGAIERFEGLLREDKTHAQAQRGLAEARERWAALEARVAEAQARLASGDPGGAIERFEGVLGDDGAHAAARRGLAEARTRQAAQQAREAEVAAALSALEATLREQDVEAVQAAFVWLVDLAPEDPRLASLRDRIAQHRERVEEDREQAAREALAEAGRLIRDGHVERALETLARVRATTPQHPDLPKLERQAQRLVAAREERMRALLASGREALDRADVDAAQGAVQGALDIDARHPEAVAMLERVRARERELGEARRADGLAAEARRLLEEGKLDESEARLSELRALAPGHRALGELAARVEETQRAQAAQAAEAIAAGEAALARDDLAAAEATLARLGELAPRHPDLASLRDRIQARRTDPELVVKNALEEAARLIRDGRPERVPEVLARVRAVAPAHPQSAKLEAQAQKVLEARGLRLRVRALVDRARKLQVRGELKEALALAEEAVRLTPDDAWTLRLRDDLAEQLTEARRRPGKPSA